MKRTDIRAGAVYAIKSSYGPPSPIVFLEDRAAGLYGRDAYGRGSIRKLTEDRYTRARVGHGYGEASRGYAAVGRNGGSGTTNAAAAAAMADIDPATELARFLNNERPSNPDLAFAVFTSLNQVIGPYDEVLAAYEDEQESERAERDRQRAAERARSERVDAVLADLRSYGISGWGDLRGDSRVVLTVDEAEKLVKLLRERKG